MNEIMSNICGRTGLAPELVVICLIGMMLFGVVLAMSAQYNPGRALERELRQLNPNHARKRIHRHW